MLRKSLLTAAVFLSLHSIARADQVIVVGFAGALTGPQAHLGKDIERGIRLAIDEINARHPVVRGVPVRFELDAEDDATDPRLATTVAQRFIDKGVAAVIGHENSGPSIVTARLYAAAHIAQITPSATNPEFTHLGYRTTFRMLANDNFLGRAISKYTVSGLQARRVAVIDDRTAYGQGIADVFVDDIAKAGVPIVAREYANDKTLDFAAQLTRIKQQRPDVIFYGGMDAQAAAILKQMRQLSIPAQLTGGDGICTQAIPRLAGNALNGNLVCADGGLTLEKMPGGHDFSARFQAKYGEPVQLYAPYAYDAMMAIYHAVMAAQSADSEKIVEALHRISFPGVSGEIAFDSRGDLRAPAATITVYRSGNKVPLTVVKN